MAGVPQLCPWSPPKSGGGAWGALGKHSGLSGSSVRISSAISFVLIRGFACVIPANPSLILLWVAARSHPRDAGGEPGPNQAGTVPPSPHAASRAAHTPANPPLLLTTNTLPASSCGCPPRGSEPPCSAPAPCRATAAAAPGAAGAPWPWRNSSHRGEDPASLRGQRGCGDRHRGGAPSPASRRLPASLRYRVRLGLRCRWGPHRASTQAVVLVRT